MPHGPPPTGSATSAASPAPPSPTSASTAALIDAVRQLAQSQKALLDALRPVPAQPAGAVPAAPAGEDVRRIVSDVLRERESSHQRSATRDRYVRERMADLPDAYRRLMPDAADAAALAA